MTPAEAREIVRKSPKYWRMALVEGSIFPLVDFDRGTSSVKLFELKKEGWAALKARKKELEAAGWRPNFGGSSKGFIRFARGEEVLGLGLDYAGRLSSERFG